MGFFQSRSAGLRMMITNQPSSTDLQRINNSFFFTNAPVHCGKFSTDFLNVAQDFPAGWKAACVD